MERDKCFSSLLYSTFKELNSLILSDYISKNLSVVSFSIKTVWIPRLGSGLMLSRRDLKFTF